jgi:hypothetical protein
MGYLYFGYATVVTKMLSYKARSSTNFMALDR